MMKNKLSLINAAILAGMTTLSIAGCSSGGSSAPPNSGGFVPNQPGAPSPAPTVPQKPAPKVEVPFNTEKVTIKKMLASIQLNRSVLLSLTLVLI